MSASYGEKQNFLRISFSQFPHVQHTTYSHGNSSPWASHPVKAGTAAQRSCQSCTVQDFGPVQPEELKSATWLSARLTYSIVNL